MKVRLACASLLIAYAGASCTTTDYAGDKSVSAASMGAVGGAVAGAVLGNQVKGSKNTRQNARIAGAVLGAAAGGAVGHVAFDKKKKELNDKIAASGIQVVKTEGTNEIQLIMPGNVGFETGKSILSSGAQDALTKIAGVLGDPEFSKDVSMLISGHTDSRGNSQANQVLSQQRADAVKVFMIGKFPAVKGGIQDRVTATGFGASQPIADNKTPEGQATNRRVEITITPKAK
ncbi:MAG: OmpA family protein [Proteobacteria bacterium]|nr:MAG: OmpA family protein [Pseudomonadota bacterium]